MFKKKGVSGSSGIVVRPEEPPIVIAGREFSRPATRKVVAGFSIAAVFGLAGYLFQNFLQVRGYVNLFASRLFLGGSVLCLMVAAWIGLSFSRHKWKFRLLSILILIGAGLVTDRLVPMPSHQAPPTPPPQLQSLSISLDCELVEFPIHIPAGEVLRILRVHKRFLEHRAILLEDVYGYSDTSRLWPTTQEAAPVQLSPRSDYVQTRFNGLRCTVRKVGAGALDQIAIPIFLKNYSSEEPYQIYIDPLDAGDKFTFYVINACYTNQPWQTDPALFGYFGNQATAHVIGEQSRRPIPLTIVSRANRLPGGIFLLQSFRRWSDLPPCF